MSAGSPLGVRRDGDVLALTLAAPERANALGPPLVEALIGAFDAHSDARACVLRAAGRHFCAGLDLDGLEALSDGDLLQRLVRIETLLQRVHHAPFPVLVLAHGAAVGAGADLFAAAWGRVAAPGSSFRMPGWNFEVALGTRRLRDLVGQDAARHMLIDSARVSAEEALAMGLATAVEPCAAWDQVTRSFVARAGALSADAVARMAALTTSDTRAEDMAALVASASRPGLRARIAAYVDAARKR